MSSLAAENAAVTLGHRRIVEGISLTLAPGQFTALVGPNGAGKTTLMRALAGLVPAEGRITLDGKALGTYAARERAQRIAYLPQGHVFHWPMPVGSVAMLGRHPHTDAFTAPSAGDRETVTRALRATGVEAFADRPVTTLSGGERARVALARALATNAPILLADEPTAALDPRHQLIVMELLRKVARGGGTVLAIAHDLTLAARFADRVLVMDRGRIVADAPPADALSPERMAQVFGVEASMIDVDGLRIPLAQRPT